MDSFLNLGTLFQTGLIVGFFVCWGFGRRQIIIGTSILLWVPSYLIYEPFYNAYFAWWAWWPYWIILCAIMLFLFFKLTPITIFLESFLRNKFKLHKNWTINKYKITAKQIKQEKLMILLYCLSMWSHFIQMLLATGLEQYWFETAYNWIQAVIAIMLMFILATPGVDRILKVIGEKHNEKDRNMVNPHTSDTHFSNRR